MCHCNCVLLHNLSTSVAWVAWAVFTESELTNWLWKFASILTTLYTHVEQVYIVLGYQIILIYGNSNVRNCKKEKTCFYSSFCNCSVCLKLIDNKKPAVFMYLWFCFELLLFFTDRNQKAWEDMYVVPPFCIQWSPNKFIPKRNHDG